MHEIRRTLVGLAVVASLSVGFGCTRQHGAPAANEASSESPDVTKLPISPESAQGGRSASAMDETALPVDIEIQVGPDGESAVIKLNERRFANLDEMHQWLKANAAIREPDAFTFVLDVDDDVRAQHVVDAMRAVGDCFPGKNVEMEFQRPRPNPGADGTDLNDAERAFKPRRTFVLQPTSRTGK